MKNFLKDIFSFENFKLGVLMSSLPNNPDPVIIAYLKNQLYEINEINKSLDDEEAA